MFARIISATSLLGAMLALTSRSVRAESESPHSTAFAAPAGMTLIPAGSYAPILRTKDEPARVAVAAFWLDVRPVTNAEFLEFVRAHPEWRRSRVSPLFADRGYLGDW